MSKFKSNKIEQFNGSNFPTWETQIRCELLGKDVWEMVQLNMPIKLLIKHPDGKQEIREFTIKMLDMGDPNEPEEVGDYRADLRKAYNILVSNLDNAHKQAVQTYTSPKQVWDYMQATYKANTVVSRANILRNIFRTDMKEGGSLEAHFGFFDSNIAAATTAGMDLGDEENLAMALLMSLPPSYEHIVTTLKTQTIDPKIKYKIAQVKTAIAQSKPQDTPRFESTALRTGSIQQEVCKYCKRHCHAPSKCWKLHPELVPERFKDMFRQREQHDKRDHSEQDSRSPKREKASIVHYAPNGRPSWTEETALIATTANPEKGEDVWIADQAASTHMTGRKEIFTDLQQVSPPIAIAGTGPTHATAKGTVRVKTEKGDTLLLTDVLYIPGLDYNLFSIPTADRKGATIITKNQTSTLQIHNIITTSHLHQESNTYIFNWKHFKLTPFSTTNKGRVVSSFIHNNIYKDLSSSD